MTVEIVIASGAKQSIELHKGSMDCFVASLLAMTVATADTPSRSRGAIRPRFALTFRAFEKSEGAGKAGCPQHPQSCARMHTGDHRCAGTPGLPCAMVLRLITRSPRRRIRLATVADGLTVHRSPVVPPESPSALHQQR